MEDWLSAVVINLLFSIPSKRAYGGLALYICRGNINITRVSLFLPESQFPCWMHFIRVTTESGTNRCHCFSLYWFLIVLWMINDSQMRWCTLSNLNDLNSKCVAQSVMGHSFLWGSSASWATVRLHRLRDRRGSVTVETTVLASGKVSAVAPRTSARREQAPQKWSFLLFLYLVCLFVFRSLLFIKHAFVFMLQFNMSVSCLTF